MTGFFSRHRHVFILAAILLALALTAGWLAVSDVRAASERTRKTILQDASDASVPLPEGAVLTQQLTLEQDCYGFLLAFDTHASIVHGTVEVTLSDEAGAVLASASIDMETLKDREFATALFAGGVAGRGQKATLTVVSHPASAADAVSVLTGKTSAEPLGRMQVNGKTAAGGLYLQQLTAYAGAHGTLRAYFGLIVLLTAVLLAGGYLLIFVRKARLQWVFCFLAAVGGLLMLALIPAGTGTDEAKHIHISYRYANAVLGVQPLGTDSTVLTVRACDAIEPDTADKLSAFTYQAWGEQWQWKAGDTSLVNKTVAWFDWNDTVPYLYAPAAAGMLLARALGLGWLPLLALARLFELIFYVVCAALAVRIAPVGKKIFFAVGLLPMSLQMGASVSDDTMVFCLALLFGAEVLAIAFRPQRVPAGRWLLLVLTALVLAPAKHVYILLLLAVFIIPLGRFRHSGDGLSPRAKRARRAVLGIAAGLLCAAAVGLVALMFRHYVLPSLQAPAVPLETQAANAENIYILPNYTIHYALTHVTDTVRLFLHTFEVKTGYYLKMMIGGYLAEPILVTVEMSGLLTGFWVLLLAASTLCEAGSLRPSPWQRTVGIGIFLLLSAATYAGCYLWTPYGSETIWGFQGRYLEPALPLALWALTPKNIVLRRENPAPLAFGITAATAWGALQTFCTVIALVPKAG